MNRRFGIICNKLILNQFQLASVRRLLAVPGTKLALLIVEEGQDEGRRASSLESIDVSEEMAQIPKVPLADVEAIRKYELDFILHFGTSILGGEILAAARYGVWAYQYDDPILQRELISTGTLERLTGEPDSGVVLRQCYLKTIPYSYKENVAGLWKAAVDMPAQVCKDILNGNGAYVDGKPSRRKTWGPATKVQVALFAARRVKAWIWNQIDGLLHSEGWNIGVVHAGIEEFLDANFHPEIRWLPRLRPKEFIADPFIEAVGPNGLELLAERFDHDRKRGYIVRVREDEQGGLSMETLLEASGHLSYPYLIRHRGAKYIIPESSSAREVALYRMDEGGGRFTRVATLVKDFAALDATVLQHEGRWWMFATDADGPKDANLHLWFAEELQGPWQPHALNPVKLDVRSSRPAGTPFYHKGTLYRPAQNCSVTYGGSTTINRVARLTTAEFEEEVVRDLRHDPKGEYKLGFHTLAAGEGFTVVDGRCDEVNPELIRRKLTYKVMRILRPGQSATGHPSTPTPQIRRC